MTFIKILRRIRFITWLYLKVKEIRFRSPFYRMCKYPICRECFRHSYWAGDGDKCFRCFKESYVPKIARRLFSGVSFATKTEPDRIKYAKDLIQPFQSDGTVNPDYVKAYKKDPRQEQSHRNYARNIHNKGFERNMEVDADFRKFERKKYGI